MIDGKFETKDAPEPEWRVSPEQTFAGQKVVGLPFYRRSLSGKRREWKQCVLVRCGCGKERVVLCTLLLPDKSKRCSSCATRLNGYANRKGTKAADGRKVCSVCKKDKPVSAYSYSAASPDGLLSGCKECRRNSDLVANYGITQKEFEGMVLAQGDKCFICRMTRPEAYLRLGIWNVDHDHNTGLVRKLLCDHCNQGLGKFNDCPALLEVAAQYLREHSGQADEFKAIVEILTLREE